MMSLRYQSIIFQNFGRMYNIEKSKSTSNWILCFMCNVLKSKSRNNQVLSFMCNDLEYESTKN